MKPLKSLIHRAGRWYIGKICLSEFRNQKFAWHNERSVEYRFALEALGAKRPQTVLDVGTGTTAWPRLLRDCGYLVTAIDNVADYWTGGMVNRHWSVLDVDITAPTLSGSFGAVTCISVLEHIRDHARAVRNMAALLAPGGMLVLTTPYAHRNPHPNVYTHPEAIDAVRDLPYICRSSAAAELDEWLACGLALERRELWEMFTGPVWATGERRSWRQARDESEPHQLGCFVLTKR